LLTPRDLLNVQFAPAWRGYNRTQVDEFIRRLIGEYEELVRKYNKLKEKEPGQAVSTDDVETSEQAVEQARQQAEEIVAGARKQAEEILDAARTQVSEEEARLAAIRQETIGFQRRMRTLLNEFSSLLDQGEAETERLLQLVGEAMDEAAPTSSRE
jgi:cell division initiation protein